jgi:hypothetical protein
MNQSTESPAKRFKRRNDEPVHEEVKADEYVDSEYENEEPVEADPEPPAGDPLLSPHGVTWTPVGNNVVFEDIRSPIQINTRLNWSANGLAMFGAAGIRWNNEMMNLSSRNPIHYFLLSFPVSVLPGIVARTNQTLADLNRHVMIDENWLFKYISMLYIMAMYPGQEQRFYWRVTAKGTTPAFNFGRYMPISLWEKVSGQISWSQSSSSDLWSPIRGLVDAFNQRRFEVVEPGRSLLVDESISANRTKRTQ